MNRLEIAMQISTCENQRGQQISSYRRCQSPESSTEEETGILNTHGESGQGFNMYIRMYKILICTNVRTKFQTCNYLHSSLMLFYIGEYTPQVYCGNVM